MALFENKTYVNGKEILKFFQDNLWVRLTDLYFIVLN